MLEDLSPPKAEPEEGALGVRSEGTGVARGNVLLLLAGSPMLLGADEPRCRTRRLG